MPRVLAHPSRCDCSRHRVCAYCLGILRPCGYVSPIDGARCIFYAGDHGQHLIAEGDENPPLRHSPEDDPSWDPEGVKAWKLRP